jgi:hypothetical protein
MMGSAIGALKVAAVRTGHTVEEYQAKVAVGLKWCTAHRDWHPRPEFAVDRSRGDGLKAKCLAADRGKPRWPRDPLKEKARSAVSAAVRFQRLPHPNSVPCMDCGHEASADEPRRHEYDHYLGYEPEHHLDVQPVCTICHATREKGRH